MDFDACVREIEALAGRRVDVRIFGPEKDSPMIASLAGALRQMGDITPPKEFERAVLETATTFVVGESTLSLLPSRFIRASHAEHDRGWIDIETADAYVRVGPHHPAWTE